MINVEEWFEIKFADKGTCNVKNVNDHWVLAAINEGKKVVSCKKHWRVSYSERVDHPEELDELLQMLYLVDERYC